MTTAVNLHKILKPHSNQWVALSPDYRKVLSHGKTLKAAASKLKVEQKRDAVFYKVIPPGYAPSSL